MHHLFVDRRADGRRVPVIPLERRLGTSLAHALLGQLVDLRGADAGRHHLPQLFENPRYELIHPSQLVNLAL